LPAQELGEFDLQVSSRLTDANAIVLGKTIQQLHTGLQHAIPAVPLRIMDTILPARCPLPVEHCGSILPMEIGSLGLSKCRPNIVAARVSFSFQSSS
jgi:hypothetical protein